jgi:hypothetical protein
MGVMQGAIQGAMIATQKGVSGGKFALYVLGGAFIGGGIGGGAGIGGAALGSAITTASVGVFATNVINGGISGLVSGASTGLAMGALANKTGKDLGRSVGWGSLMGLVGGLASGAVIGGIEAGIQNSIFKSGCRELGINPKKPIPKELRTDKFLAKAKDVWFKKAPNGGGALSTENIPADILVLMNNEMPPAAGATVPHFVNDISAGTSDLYLHTERAFTSAKQLFVTMGHELVHVSQFLALDGSISAKQYQLENFKNMLEYQAYNFSNSIGGNYWHQNFNQNWFDSPLGLYFNYLSTTNTSWQFNFRP